jgi:hypothetical protein
VFFVDGLSGTGKTYLYKAFLAKVQSMDLKAIATTTSGIVVSIMPGGRATHSRFKIPIKMDNTVCVVSQSRVGQPNCLREHLLLFGMR